jgi:hypothetical protein
MESIDYLSKPSLIKELRRMIDNSMTIKGTYIKTMPDDIFDEPVNKTTDLHNIKIGKQTILVPIVQEKLQTDDAIPEELLDKLLSKIKNPKARAIFQKYMSQLKDIEAEPIVVKEKVKFDESEMKRKKDELVDKMKKINTNEELENFMREEKIEEFLKDLKDSNFKYTLAGFNRSLTAVKNKITKEGAKAQFVAEAQTKKMQQKADEKEASRKEKIETRQQAKKDTEAAVKAKAEAEKMETERLALGAEAERFMTSLSKARFTSRTGLNKFLRNNHHTNLITQLQAHKMDAILEKLKELLQARVASLKA